MRVGRTPIRRKQRISKGKARIRSIQAARGCSRARCIEPGGTALSRATPGQEAINTFAEARGSTNRGKTALSSQQPNEKGPPPGCRGRVPEVPARGCGISDRRWLPLPAGEGEHPTGGLSDGSDASPDVACCSATLVVRRAPRTACHLLQRCIALGDDPPQQRRSAEASRA